MEWKFHEVGRALWKKATEREGRGLSEIAEYSRRNRHRGAMALDLGGDVREGSEGGNNMVGGGDRRGIKVLVLGIRILANDVAMRGQ